MSKKAARDVKWTFGLGIALILALLAVTLTHSPPRVLRSNAPAPNAQLATLIAPGEICQEHESLPAGVTAIRLSAGAYFGSPVHVTVSDGTQLLTQGRRGAEWTGSSVTIPVTPLSRGVSNAKLCLDAQPVSELMYFQGVATPSARDSATLGGQRIGGKLLVEYLGDGRGSWWSRIGSIVDHMQFGRAFSGKWIVWLIVTLMALVALLALRLPLRELSSGRTATLRFGKAIGRVPTAAWVCALIALLNATAWALIVPAFEGKDEVDHFAYVETLAENHTLPDNGHENGVYSPQLQHVLGASRYFLMTHTPQAHAIFTAEEQRSLTSAVHAGESMRSSGEAGIATSEPPLYYALQTIPYELAHGNILTQLLLMRLAGALFGAITALLIFFFLTELVPDTPWVATVGAVCMALQPMFAFMSGSLSPDALLFTMSAAVFLCIVRAFRRGFTTRLAVVFGLVIAAGFVTKLNFLAIGLGAYVALVALALPALRSKNWRALLAPAIAAGIGALPVVLYMLRNIAMSRPALGILGGSTGLISAPSLSDELSYMWQLFLPKLPGMTPYFEGLHTYKDIWFDRSVGLYGWMDTVFPTWVDNAALVPAAALAVLCGRELVVRRAALKAHLFEFVVYLVLIGWVMVMLGISSYHDDGLGHGPAFGEPRYLLPLLALLGAVVVMAVRGAGRRWMAVAGAAMVVLFLGHDLFSQLQVVARYYG